MKEVNRRNSTVEKLFITNDGKEFTYRSEAYNHELDNAIEKLEDIDKEVYESEYLPINMTIYNLESEEEREALLEYLDLIDLSCKDDINIPASVSIIIIDNKKYCVSGKTLLDIIENEVEKVTQLISY